MNLLIHAKKRLVALASLTLLAIALAGTAYAASPSGLVEVTSHNGFGPTVGNLEQAVSQNGLVVLKKFNQQQMLAMVGMHVQNEMAFEIFHPKYGKTIYDNNPVGFLAVPLRILVVQSSSGVKLYYQKPSTVLAPFGLSALGNQLDPVFHTIVEAAAK